MSQLVVYLIFVISIIVAGVIGMIAGTISNYLYNKRGKEWDSLYPDKVKLIAECEDVLSKNREKAQVYICLKQEINKALDVTSVYGDNTLSDWDEKIEEWKAEIKPIMKDVCDYFEAETTWFYLKQEKHRYCMGKIKE